ncbi:diguanylate cyclase domain-containing protein [Aquipuribacter nitratireducens]|uniref:Diguanylate cyclase domain-containing protein n=1 Tax=Aquipuribacter nitratireducens TaxID=650104 RepID=A0ABW0GNR9_9MICO
MRSTVLFLVAFTAAAVLGRLTATTAASALSGLSLVWPAAGVAVLWATQVRRPRQALAAAGLMAASVTVVNVLTGIPASQAPAFAASNLVHAAVGAGVLCLLRAGPRPMTSVRGASLVLVGSFAAAAAGAAVLFVATPVYVDGPLAAFLVLVRNLVSTALVLSVAWTWPPKASEVVAARRAEAAVLLAATVAGYWLVFLVADGLNIAYATIPLTLWAAMRLGRFLTSAHLVLTWSATVTLTVLGHGPFAGAGSPTTRVLLAQGFLAVLALVAMSVAISRHEREELLEAVRVSEARARRSVDTAFAGHVSLRLRPDGTTTEVRTANPATATLLRRAAGEVVGSDWLALVHSDDVREVRAGLVAVASGRAASWEGDARVLLPDGTARWLHVLVGADLVGRDGDAVRGARLTVQMVDATDRKDAEQRLTRLALHDELTGLPNRTLLLDRLAQGLAGARRDGSSVGVLFVDLDRFKAVNDTFGHQTGDELLVLVARRLCEAVRPADTVARLGGDEFVVCCPGLAGPADADAFAARLMERMAEPLVVGRTALDVGVSGGLTLSEPDDDPQRLLERADAAMYRAKRAGRGRITREGSVVPAPR